jgi:hypothetical protein
MVSETFTERKVDSSYMSKTESPGQFLSLYITISFLLTLVLLALGCGEEDLRPPIIFSITAEPDIILPGESSTITVQAGDPDKDDISYIWTTEDGQIQGSGKTVTWLSPETEGKYILTVTVSDGIDSVTETVDVWVWVPRQGDYYPLEVGNTWTFRDKDNNTINFEIIDTIDISGVTAYVKQMTTTKEEGAANYSYMAKSSDVIYQYAMGGANISGDTLIFEPELPVYKFPLVPGNSWEVEFNVWVPDGYWVGNGTAVYEVISEEDLTVEAGSFQHVFKVKEDFIWELIQEVTHIVSYHWVAPNVGVVKFIQEEEVGGEIILNEATLQYYSLK